MKNTDDIHVKWSCRMQQHGTSHLAAWTVHVPVPVITYSHLYTHNRGHLLFILQFWEGSADRGDSKPSTCWLFLHRGCCGLSSSLPCPATVLRAHQDSYLQSSSCSLEKQYSKWFNDAVSPVCFILCKMMKSTCRWQLFYFEHCLWKKYGFRVTIAHSW